MNNRPSGAPVYALNDGDSDAAGQCRQREPEMIGVHGKPGPAPIEPWLQGIAVHPMLAHKIREGELRIRRDLHTHHGPRSGQRRVWKASVRTRSSRLWAYNLIQKYTKHQYIFCI